MPEFTFDTPDFEIINSLPPASIDWFGKTKRVLLTEEAPKLQFMKPEHKGTARFVEFVCLKDGQNVNRYFWKKL